MNIVFVTNTYWPSKDGVQMVNQYLAEGLAQRGHQVTVLTIRGNIGVPQETHHGVSIKRFDIFYTKLRTYKGDVSGFQECLLEMERSGKMDVMITVCVNSFSGQCAFSVIDRLRCKKIAYNHGMRDGRLHLDKITSLKSLAKEIVCGRLDGRFYKRNWRHVMKYDAAIHLFPHDSSHNYYVSHGFPNNHVILNACEKELFEDGAGCAPKALDGEAPYFLYVGNYCQRKDQMRALESFYRADVGDMRLVLIGSERNDYCEKLLGKAEALQKKYPEHGRAHVLYGVDRPETVRMIRGCYACLMTSMNEYFPITIVEAMAAGKPFLSTNVGIVSQIPGGQIAHTTDELAYWMEFFARNGKYVRRLGQIAREYAEENLRVEDKVEALEGIVRGIGCMEQRSMK